MIVRLRTVLLLTSIWATLVPSLHAQPRPEKRKRPESPAMAQPVPRLGYVSFFVLDLDRALSFYVGKLGMREQARIPLPNGVQEVLLGFGDGAQQAGVILMYDAKRKTPYERGDGFSRFVVYVAELRPLIKRLSEQSVSVVVQPTTVENLKLTYALIRDPDGYMIEFIER